ncbi:hypothetical protein FACS1894171_0040 [Clostridia bacterium]|nr:hypothetical protein FACS1894171_0040 [Clostridia bacterium]
MYINPYNSYSNSYSNGYQNSLQYNGLQGAKKGLFNSGSGIFNNTMSDFWSNFPEIQTGISFNKSRYEFTSALSSTASLLRGSLNSLKSAAARPTMNTVSSSDNSVLTASAAPSSAALRLDKLNVSVDSLATSRTTTSGGFDSKSVFGQGTLSMDITAGGKTKSVFASIGANDDSKTALGKMASAINGANAGVSASVLTENGKSSLKIESQTTGSGASGVFGVSNVTLGGTDQTALFGLNDANTKNGENARYSVNGEQTTSESNNISLEGGVKAKLTGTGDAEVSFKANYDNITSAAENFVSAYNSLRSWLNDNSSSFKGAAALGQELDRLTSSSWRSLGAAGLSTDSKGIMSMNKSADQSETVSGLKNLFSDYSSTGNALSQKLGKMISSPSSFAAQSNQYKFYSSAGSYSMLFNMINGGSMVGQSSGNLFDALL